MNKPSPRLRFINKKFLSFLLSILLFSSNFLFSQADWTILSYIQADNNLYDYVMQDLTEMSVIGSGQNLNIVAQLDMPHNVGTWRYKVEKGKLTLDTYLETEMGMQVDQELIDSMRWAVTKYPAKHYMLILSSHGIGVIDPAKAINRGILFDDSQGTYLNNQQLALALNQIKTNILGGRKLDILGMDACLMAMLEVGYQVKDYANLFVASQESEHAMGWPYTTFLSPLSQKYCTPLQVATYAVTSFGQFYQSKTPYYTQSAVDLNNINLVKQNIDNVVANLNACKKLESEKIKDIIQKARNVALEFDLDDYVDLYSFYFELSQQLSKSSLRRPIFGPRPSSLMPRPTNPRPTSPRPTVSNPRPSMPRPVIGAPRPITPRPTNPRPRPSSPRPMIPSPRPSSPRPTIPNPRPTISQPIAVNPRPTAPRPRPRPPRPTTNTVQPTPTQQTIPQQNTVPAQQPKTEYEEKVDLLKRSLTDGMNLIESIVVANVVGSRMQAAKGLSIYFPKNRIHSSYTKTKFAQDGLWLQFLSQNI